MSHVAGVMIVMELGSHEDASDVIAQLRTTPVGSFHFAELDDQFGGDKHPQFDCIGAGINFLDIVGFVAFLRHSVNWGGRENVVAYIQDENDDQPWPVQILGEPTKPKWAEAL